MDLPGQRRFRAVVCCAFGLSTACTHVVMRPTSCPEDVRNERGSSSLAWERGAGPVPVSGSVFRVIPYEPLRAALVDLSSIGSDGVVGSRRLAMHTDSLGQFAFDSVAEGRYLLRVRRIGFGPAADTIDVKAEAGIVGRAVLAMDVVMLDGCGYGMIETRVPWWVRK